MPGNSPNYEDFEAKIKDCRDPETLAMKTARGIPFSLRTSDLHAVLQGLHHKDFFTVETNKQFHVEGEDYTAPFALHIAELEGKVYACPDKQWARVIREKSNEHQTETIEVRAADALQMKMVQKDNQDNKWPKEVQQGLYTPLTSGYLALISWDILRQVTAQELVVKTHLEMPDWHDLVVMLELFKTPTQIKRLVPKIRRSGFASRFPLYAATATPTVLSQPPPCDSAAPAPSAPTPSFKHRQRGDETNGVEPLRQQGLAPARTKGFAQAQPKASGTSRYKTAVPTALEDRVATTFPVAALTAAAVGATASVAQRVQSLAGLGQRGGLLKTAPETSIAGLSIAKAKDVLTTVEDSAPDTVVKLVPTPLPVVNQGPSTTTSSRRRLHSISSTNNASNLTPTAILHGFELATVAKLQRILGTALTAYLPTLQSLKFSKVSKDLTDDGCLLLRLLVGECRLGIHGVGKKKGILCRLYVYFQLKDQSEKAPVFELNVCGPANVPIDTKNVPKQDDTQETLSYLELLGRVKEKKAQLYPLFRGLGSTTDTQFIAVMKYLFILAAESPDLAMDDHAMPFVHHFRKELTRACERYRDATDADVDYDLMAELPLNPPKKRGRNTNTSKSAAWDAESTGATSLDKMDQAVLEIIDRSDIPRVKFPRSRKARSASSASRQQTSRARSDSAPRVDLDQEIPSPDSDARDITPIRQGSSQNGTDDVHRGYARKRARTSFIINTDDDNDVEPIPNRKPAVRDLGARNIALEERTRSTAQDDLSEQATGLEVSAHEQSDQGLSPKQRSYTDTLAKFGSDMGIIGPTSPRLNVDVHGRNENDLSSAKVRSASDHYGQRASYVKTENSSRRPTPTFAARKSTPTGFPIPNPSVSKAYMYSPRPPTNTPNSTTNQYASLDQEDLPVDSSSTLLDRIASIQSERRVLGAKIDKRRGKTAREEAQKDNLDVELLGLYQRLEQKHGTHYGQYGRGTGYRGPGGDAEDEL
jgi:hypothetical protein